MESKYREIVMTNIRRDFSKFTLEINYIFSFIAAIIFFGICSMPAHATTGVISNEDKACLDCHAKQDYSKKRADGKTISLHVDNKLFSESVHNPGCTDCHKKLDPESDHNQHAKADNQQIGTREYAIAEVAVCRRCHKKNVKLYNDSLHAALVREGNKDAPLCSDCHDPHAVRSHSASGPMVDVPCKKCHEKIYTAYASSVHGLERSKQVGKLGPDVKKAPICADCHQSHEIKAASTEGRIKDACLNCHKGALSKHQQWLPNAEQHFEAISCPVCHVPTAKRRVDLRLYDSKANKDITEKQGVPQFENFVQAADIQGQGLNALALQSLLKEFNREGSVGTTVLRGRLEVSSGAEAHQLVDKSHAIKDCNTCHRAGADVFQTVVISIDRPDGLTVQHGAQKEVLTSTISMDSVRGFYAIGGTRIKILDVLFVLALLAGIAFPIGHVSLNWLFKIYLKRMEAERKTEHLQTTDRPLSDDNSKKPDTTKK
ncbi:MAG: multiheme c-type cytochrome [Burkholderiales bacterium]